MLKKGDILQLRVSYSDGSGAKARPCVIIAKHNSDWNFLEISSKDHLKNDEYCYLLSKENYHLKKNSYIKIWKINTIDQTKLPNTPAVLDSLSQKDLQKIIEKLNSYFLLDSR
ncbi:MAG: type II toxin-antitoxin system PemK/MazF family toxin [bacterium]